MTAAKLPGPGLSPEMRVQDAVAASQPAATARLTGAHPRTAPVNQLRSEFIHDTCPLCGWDGDAPLTWDRDTNLIGWECPDPDCRAWWTVRDLEEVD